MALWPVRPTKPAYTGDGAVYSEQMTDYVIDYVGDELAQAMADFDDEVQALTPSVNAALAGSNYQGDYNAGTLYAMGESVSYGGYIWLKKTAAAAGTTPAIGANWERIHLGVDAPVDIQLFSASGTYTRGEGVTRAVVYCVQAGANGSNTNGGSSGAVTISVVAPGATETVTVGAAPSGASSFGSLCSSSSGDASFSSRAATTSTTYGVRKGGDTPLGFGEGGSNGAGGSDNGENGKGFGAGGGGRGSTGGTPGNGTNGCVLVMEYR